MVVRDGQALYSHRSSNSWCAVAASKTRPVGQRQPAGSSRVAESNRVESSELAAALAKAGQWVSEVYNAILQDRPTQLCGPPTGMTE